MNIWVDADACPRAAREILCRAANRCKITTVFVANHFLSLPDSGFVSFWQVSPGFDVADNIIVERVGEGDLVISSDIPLAAAILQKQPACMVLNAHGEAYTTENIQSRLSMRNFMESMRSDYGQQGSGKRAYSHVDSKAFADRLDRILASSPLR